MLPTIIPIQTPMDSAASSGVGMGGMGSLNLQICVAFWAETHDKVVESSFMIEQQVSAHSEHSYIVSLRGNGTQVSGLIAH